MQVLTLEQFIIQAIEIHGGLYDYSFVEYATSHIKVKIVCKKHGIFLQTPNNHLSGKGCDKCAREALKNLLTFTTEKFIAEALLIHGSYYDYLKTIYINSHTKVIITCKIHGDFEQIPYEHLKGRGCGKCRQHNKQINWIERANMVHNYRYDYSLVYFIASNKKIIIICREHGAFEQTPANHILGQNCPKCIVGYSYKEEAWLDFLHIPQEYRQIALKINGKNFTVDALYNNTVYEFYGDYWHGNPNKYSLGAINPSNHRKYSELYHITLDREKIIKEAGYRIISIWEQDWDILQKRNISPVAIIRHIGVGE